MSAPYCLAIDIGTSRTSAAIARSAPDGSLLATPFPLGRSSDNAPTVVFVSDGDLLFGDAAERRGHTQPERLIREYKRRIGDDVPILAADRSFAPEELYALTVDWAARAVVEREGATPDRLAITVPAAWGGYRSDLVREALTAQGWRDVVVLTEPEAAARHYEATNPLADGGVLAVYDFGGGTFDAVALRKEPGAAVRIVGSPTGIPDLGGADFDDTIVRHVVRTAQVEAALLAGTPSGRMALAALRRECVEAKESLSFDCEAVIPVLLGTDQRSVRLSRDEFETMIADELQRTVEAFQSALDAAGVSVAELEAILLTGGTSRIPRVAQVLSERFDRPIAVDADPKAIIALGAARAAADAAHAAASAGAVEDDEATLALTETAPPAAAPRRGWFRRVPSGAFVTVGAAVLITGMGIAGAPALGTATLTASERAGTTVEPASLHDLGGSSTNEPDPAQTPGPTSAAPGPAAPPLPRTPAKKPAASHTAADKNASPQAPRTTGASSSAPGGGGAAPAGGTAQSGAGSTAPTGGTTDSGPGEDGGSAGSEPGATDTGADPGDGTGGGTGEAGGDGGAGETGGDTGETGGDTGETGGETGGTGGSEGGTPGDDSGTPPPTDPTPQESPLPPDSSPAPAAV